MLHNRTSRFRNCSRYRHAHQRCPAIHPTCPICALHHTLAAPRCQHPTCPRGGNHTPVPSCYPTSRPNYCNCGNHHTPIFKECPARHGPAPSTLLAGPGPTEVALVTPRQPPPAGPLRPGTTQDFGGPLPLKAQSPSPAPFHCRARPGNE